jgi:hypothetical protein
LALAVLVVLTFQAITVMPGHPAAIPYSAPSPLMVVEAAVPIMQPLVLMVVQAGEATQLTAERLLLARAIRRPHRRRKAIMEVLEESALTRG